MAGVLLLPHSTTVTTIIVADSYYEEHVATTLGLLPDWIDWCIDRSGFTGAPPTEPAPRPPAPPAISALRTTAPSASQSDASPGSGVSVSSVHREVDRAEQAGVEGIEAAYLFGSWAARYAGEPGRAPADLDVLGVPDRDDLDAAAQRAEGRLAREVNVTIRSAAWWREGTDGFHADVTRRPLVPLFSEEGAG